MRRPVAQFRAVQSARSLLRVAAKLIVLAALAASVPGGAAAQGSFGSVATGDRIRISAAPLGSSTRTGRVLAASETLHFGLRPAHYVALAGLVVVMLAWLRRITGMPRVRSRLAA